MTVNIGIVTKKEENETFRSNFWKRVAQLVPARPPMDSNTPAKEMALRAMIVVCR